MINSVKGKWAKAIIDGRKIKGFPSDILDRTTDKISILIAATTLTDLKSPPGNRLETLKGDREGQHSIRINDQWRICFFWNEDTGAAHDVEIVDYH